MTKEQLEAERLVLRFLLKLPFDKEVVTENEHGKWSYDSEQLAKEHAIICVSEIIESLTEIPDIKVVGNVLLDEIEFHQSVLTHLEE